MKLLALYIVEFNRHYLLDRDDRRRTLTILGSALTYLSMFLVACLVMWMAV